MIKKMDKTLLFTSIFLLVIGLIMVFSASNVTSFMKYKTTPYYFFNRQLLFLFLSLILGFVILRFNTKSYGYISLILIPILIAALEIALLLASVKVTVQLPSL